MSLTKTAFQFVVTTENIRGEEKANHQLPPTSGSEYFSLCGFTPFDAKLFLLISTLASSGLCSLGWDQTDALSTRIQATMQPISCVVLKKNKMWKKQLTLPIWDHFYPIRILASQDLLISPCLEIRERRLAYSLFTVNRRVYCKY